MIASLRRLQPLLSAADKRQLSVLLVMIPIMAGLELVGIASIFPFLHLAASPEAIADVKWLAAIYNFFGFSSRRNMLIACGCAVIGLLVLSNAMKALFGWRRQKIAWDIAHNVSLTLVRTYSKLSYQFFLTHDSADLIKKNINDVQKLVNGVLIAGSQFVCQTIISATIFGLLVTVQPVIAICVLAAVTVIYVCIYLGKRRYLRALGQEQMNASYSMYKAFVEFVGGIKSIQTEGVEDFFIDRFEHGSRRYSDVHPRFHAVASLPRYFVESLTFGGIVAATLVLVTSNDNFVALLPTVSLVAFACYRLMPAVNQAYASLAQVVNSCPAIDGISEDLNSGFEQTVGVTQSAVGFNQSIELQNVHFNYQGTTDEVITDVSLKVQKGEKVAFVGPTGSGKTTLVDIIAAILSPSQGKLMVDDVFITPEHRRAWQDAVAYVPQDVFLYDDTIANNIAFGLPEVNQDQLKRACGMAQLSSFIEEDLADGYATLIGERGVRLSGGQRQRIGLARALYRNPQVLLLDESTSALDNRTESTVVNAIHNQLPGVTIIMIAHRISTVRDCDRLYLIDRGRLTDSGSYEELLSSSKLFREIAKFT